MTLNALLLCKENLIWDLIIFGGHAIAVYQKKQKEGKKIGLKDPNAMNVASASKDGIPSSRMVLLKSFDENGFTTIVQSSVLAIDFPIWMCRHYFCKFIHIASL